MVSNLSRPVLVLHGSRGNMVSNLLRPVLVFHGSGGNMVSNLIFGDGDGPNLCRLKK